MSEKLARLLSTALDGSLFTQFLVCDRSGLILSCNEALTQRLGGSRERLVGQPVWDFFHGDDVENLRHQLEQGTPAPVELTLRLPDKTRFLGHLCVEPWGFVLLGQPHDEEGLRVQQSHHLAQESARLKAQFIANMSHEIRTPLNAIMGMAHLLSKTQLNLQQREYLRYILGGGQALLRLVNDILDFSKMDSGQLELKLIEFQIQTIAEGLLGQLSAQAQAKGLKLTVRLEPDVPTRVLGDPVRLSQLLMCLLNNAIKFTDQGEVTLQVSRRPPNSSPTEGRVGLDFRIQDSGIGMSREEIGRLFSVFSQADESLTRDHQGAGLGLALSRQLVHLMGGEIGVESAPGKGSLFTVSLDFPSPGSRTVDSQALFQPVQREGGPGQRVLVVEDNQINQRIVRELLENAGMAVDLANNGAEALEKIASCGETSPWRLILMDLQMPEMDGYTASASIRKDRRFDSVPIIAMSAHVLPDEKARCLESGMDEFLPKPIEPEAWWTTLSRWLPTYPSGRAETELPQVEGLDCHEGVRRVAGNRSLYGRLLLDFADGCPDLVGKLEQALAAEDLERVRFLAHSLRGEAGNLGALELFRQAGQLESMAASRDRVGVQACLPDLTQRFFQLAESIRSGVQEEHSEAGTDSVWSPSQVEDAVRALERLEGHLQNSEGASLDSFEEVVRKAPGLAGRLEKLKALIFQFDFGAAIQELQQVRQELLQVVG